MLTTPAANTNQGQRSLAPSPSQQHCLPPVCALSLHTEPTPRESGGGCGGRRRTGQEKDAAVVEIRAAILGQGQL